MGGRTVCWSGTGARVGLDGIREKWEREIFEGPGGRRSLEWPNGVLECPFYSE